LVPEITQSCEPGKPLVLNERSPVTLRFVPSFCKADDSSQALEVLFHLKVFPSVVPSAIVLAAVFGIHLLFVLSQVNTCPFVGALVVVSTSF